MRIFITVAIASFGVIGVFSIGGGGGGLFEGGLEEGLGGGGYHGTIIGLSRGIEIKHGGGGEEGGKGEGGEGGGGGGGGGKEEKKGGGGGGGGGGGHGIGWGGSHFNTPVDVHHEEVVHIKAYPEYKYEYKVADHKTKDYKSKQEVRDGYKVKGSYSLLEPDHKTIRVVDYVSDKKRGFIAKVSYRKHE